jgi:DNA polymerase III alpha subunit
MFLHAHALGIRFGLTAIKNVGENAIVFIVAANPSSHFDFWSASICAP